MSQKLNSSTLLFILFLTNYLTFSKGSAQAIEKDSSFLGIELNASVDRSEAPLNQKITYTVELSWEGEQERYKVEMAKALPLENLEISGSVSISQKKVVEGKLKSFKTYKFFLKPLCEGGGKIDQAEFRYVDIQTADTFSLFTQPVMVKIAPPVLKQKKSPLPYLIFILVLIFFSITLIVLRKKEKGGKKESEDIEEKTFEEKTKDELSSLRDLLGKKEIDNFFQNLYLVLTSYIELKYHIYAKGKTTIDIFNSLLNLDLDEAKLTLFKEILTQCDLFKYADEKFRKKDLEQILDRFEEILEQK